MFPEDFAEREREFDHGCGEKKRPGVVIRKVNNGFFYAEVGCRGMG